MHVAGKRAGHGRPVGRAHACSVVAEARTFMHASRQHARVRVLRMCGRGHVPVTWKAKVGQDSGGRKCRPCARVHARTRVGCGAAGQC
jgi:hypothetical protein